jgi:hypothetical protein
MSDEIGYIWDGASMVPLDIYLPRAQAQFQPGRRYHLITHRSKSGKSVGQFFAVLHKAWQNLPERYGNRFPDEIYLRKWAMVQEHFAYNRQIPFAHKEHIPAIVHGLRMLDPYVVIYERGDVLDVWCAESVSGMDHERFQDCKDKVLMRVAHMIGICVDDLIKWGNHTT